jgi:hypothetical protein
MSGPDGVLYAIERTASNSPVVASRITYSSRSAFRFTRMSPFCGRAIGLTAPSLIRRACEMPRECRRVADLTAAMLRHRSCSGTECGHSQGRSSNLRWCTRASSRAPSGNGCGWCRARPAGRVDHAFVDVSAFSGHSPFSIDVPICGATPHAAFGVPGTRLGGPMGLPRASSDYCQMFAAPCCRAKANTSRSASGLAVRTCWVVASRTTKPPSGEPCSSTSPTSGAT